MQIVAILWEPNAAWKSLSPARQWQYLESLDAAIAAARSSGVIVLGWSRIDRALPRAPDEGFVGVFGVTDAASAHQFEKAVAAAGWYDYFDSRNVSVDLAGGTSATPHLEYARLLGLARPA